MDERKVMYPSPLRPPRVAEDESALPKAALARTRSLQSSLTPSEAAVAGFVLAHAEQVVRISIDALARRAGVSTATVLRFCESVGFQGFRDFKIALAVEVANMPVVLPGEVHADDTPIQIATKVLHADMQAIGQTLDLLDEEAFARAVDLLDSAKRIEVYGVGSSAPIAVDAYYRLLRIGIRVAVVTDSHMQAVSAALLAPGDVALVISHTGRTRETLDTAGEAHRAGATVIALTSYLGTPIEKAADITLVTATAETAFRVEAMASRIAHLSVIDALYVALANRRLGRALTVLERTNLVIEKKRIYVSGAVQAVRDAAGTQHVVMWRGMGYSLPQHSALLTNIRGIILDLDGVVYQGSTLLPGVREFLAFLRDSQRRVVAVTNHSGASSIDYADKLKRMGVPLGEPDIVTSAWAAAKYIVRLNPQARFFVLGSAALKAELLSAGLTESMEAEYVVVGYDPGVTLSQLLEATPRLVRGATLVATNPDLVLPTPDGPIPECGMFLALLEAASGKRATVVGKPNPFIIDLALNRLGLSRDDVLIVGDTFETDVVAGLAAGIRTALVLTGNTKLAPPGQYRPTVIVPNLKALQMLLAKA